MRRTKIDNIRSFNALSRYIAVQRYFVVFGVCDEWHFFWC